MRFRIRRLNLRNPTVRTIIPPCKMLMISGISQSKKCMSASDVYLEVKIYRLSIPSKNLLCLVFTEIHEKQAADLPPKIFVHIRKI